VGDLSAKHTKRNSHLSKNAFNSLQEVTDMLNKKELLDMREKGIFA